MAEIQVEDKVQTQTKTVTNEHTKVCPSCGATLFADMDICYGCLYDFTKTYEPPQIGVADEVPLDVYEQLSQSQIDEEKSKVIAPPQQELSAVQKTSDSVAQACSVLCISGPSVNLSFGCTHEGIRLFTSNTAPDNCEGVCLDRGTKIHMGNLVFMVQ
ncbi:hypothetical protein [Atopobium fossor]|uniref:hypothetical protein n=1 Tax=Atopobium fossor TaxID=39487 RepID=UPI000483A1FE|nr:hypothetical protein [Atopobium fossor]